MTPEFSFVLPTRSRLEMLQRLCDSIRACTSHPERLEIVLVVDSDDEPSLRFSYDELNIRKVEVAPGLGMGQLNMAGYRAAAGRYLMLVNDDIVIRTPGWDDRVMEVFRGYPDGMVMVHVNETIFQEKLCTFPCLSRAFCELAHEIFPSGYLRYRIDDHIHNIFDLLTLLGRRRRIFLPDVVFEHHNFVDTTAGREYVPDPEIHAADSRLFEALLPERKRLALAAMEVIERHSRSEKRRTWESLLAPVSDSVSIRDPGHARFYPLGGGGRPRPRATVGIVSADVNSDLARKCVDLVKQHTRDFDLVVVDNNRSPDFNHPREMNRLLEFCRTDYLVLMDDDVFVGEGWLEGMFRAMTPGVGVVTPVHNDRNGNFSYAGVVMQPDDSGHHAHIMSIGDQPQNIQTLCSAIMLIDVPRCGHIRLDETYSKYFLDIDYGLRVWEEGFRVLCSPWSRVTHIGGGTIEQGSNRGVKLFEDQRRHYVREWVRTHRIQALRNGIWKGIPEFDEITSLRREIDNLFCEGARLPVDTLLVRARGLAGRLTAVPALRNYMAVQARAGLAGRFPRADDPEAGHLAVLLGVSGQPVLYRAGLDGMNVVLWNGSFYALPSEEGVFDYDRMCRGGYSRSYQAGEFTQICAMISCGGNGADLSDGAPRLSPGSAAPSATAVIAPSGQPLTPDKQGLKTSATRLLRVLASLGLALRTPGAIRGLFDADYYRATYPDVAAAGVNPLLHFIVAGAFEGRDPHPLFNTGFYLCTYPDVAASRMNPVAHYLKFGAAEGRAPHPLFDTRYYVNRYSDVLESGLNPLVHYCVRGAAEGRKPHPWFDPEYYLSHCPDTGRNGENPLVHFLRSPLRCYNPHPFFDCRYYLRENPDVAQSGVNPLIHFVQFGLLQGRHPSEGFDPQTDDPDARSRRTESKRRYSPVD